MQASDTPVKARFVPLGEFIKRVGPAPPDVALVTYLQRLKEQGWNVDRTERKMLMCGVNSIAEDKASSSALAGNIRTLHCQSERSYQSFISDVDGHDMKRTASANQHRASPREGGNTWKCCAATHRAAPGPLPYLSL